MQAWVVVAALACLGACAAPAPDPERLVLGVAGDRAAGAGGESADQEMRAFLDRKANQICTGGYDSVKVDTLAAEENAQIVAEDLRCKAYRLSL